MNIESLLNNNINTNYKRFHERICQTKYEILGIKIPILRKISKELLKSYNYNEIFSNLNDKYYEHVMIKGIVIGNLKIDYEERIRLIDEFLPLIDNWGICDIFVSELKFIKNNQEEFLKYLISILDTQKEYYTRFVIVVLLNYYINDKYIDFIFNTILSNKSEYYYVKMANAWCLSFCLIKYFDKTVSFLNRNKDNIDKWTYNKALQKGIESFRINESNKDILRSMKI